LIFVHQRFHVVSPVRLNLSMFPPAHYAISSDNLRRGGEAGQVTFATPANGCTRFNITMAEYTDPPTWQAVKGSRSPFPEPLPALNPNIIQSRPQRACFRGAMPLRLGQPRLRRFSFSCSAAQGKIVKRGADGPPSGPHTKTRPSWKEGTLRVFTLQAALRKSPLADVPPGVRYGGECERSKVIASFAGCLASLPPLDVRRG